MSPSVPSAEPQPAAASVDDRDDQATNARQPEDSDTDYDPATTKCTLCGLSACWTR